MIILVWLPQPRAVVHLARWSEPMGWRRLCDTNDLLQWDEDDSRLVGATRRWENAWLQEQSGPEPERKVCQRCVYWLRREASDVEHWLADRL